MNYHLDAATHPELVFPGPLRRGDSGPGVRRVQEWLCLHGTGVAIDGEFGPATEAALPRTDEPGRTLTEKAWRRLTRDLSLALGGSAAADEALRSARGDLPRSVKAVAVSHLAAQPREVGGQNRGPWVRTYMGGREGPAYPWCAGFVSFVLAQSCRALGVEMPIAGSFSCDTMAQQADAADRLVGGDLAAAPQVAAGLSRGCIFLVRGRAVGDWVHTGFAHDFQGETFATIEGNTNDSGEREGFEVCARRRAVAGKDFIRLDGEG